MERDLRVHFGTYPGFRLECSSATRYVWNLAISTTYGLYVQLDFGYVTPMITLMPCAIKADRLYYQTILHNLNHEQLQAFRVAASDIIGFIRAAVAPSKTVITDHGLFTYEIPHAAR